MIQRQLKLQLTKAQECELNRWLWHLTGVWNWAIRKVELDAKDGIYYGRLGFSNLLSGHGLTLGIPAHTLQQILKDAHSAWTQCFRRIRKQPRLKGQRNRLNSIGFPDPFKSPVGNRISLPKLGSIRFHKQSLPGGRIKCGRIVKRASGWYLCLFIEVAPQEILKTGNGEVGVDFGFTTLATLSTGEKIEHPRELQVVASRLAQAQRGNDKQLVARLKEREANCRKDRNHKLSRRLVSENAVIAVSKDSSKRLAKSHFGKSVSAAGHGQLRQMLAYKCRAGGRRYIEVSPRNSTRTCSSCGALTGPTGWAGLKVRHWECAACGADHDRDVNAAVNTLNAGLGLSLDLRREAVSEIL